jgi:hypothetical protein
MLMRKILKLALFSGLIISCEDNILRPGPHEFALKVVDEQNHPLEGAHIAGGVDWDEFHEVTNANGLAILPDFARGWWANIYKDYFYSIWLDSVQSRVYSIRRTAYELVEIGPVAGTPVRFRDGQLITLTYLGVYRFYQYDDAGVQELSAAGVPFPVRDARLYGDTLWYATHDNGIYLFSLQDPASPRLLSHLRIPAYPYHFDRKDSLIAIGSEDIRLYAIHADSSVELLDFDSYPTDIDLKFISNFLVATRSHGVEPLKVFDISNPYNMSPIYEPQFDFYSYAFLHGDTAIVSKGYNYRYQEFHEHLAIDLSDPASPVEMYWFTAPGDIRQIIDDSLAVGTYSFHRDAITIFRRIELARFDVLTMKSESSFILFFGREFGTNPPYFVFGPQLYKMVER